jgi:sulfate adenylyltransferase
MEEANYKSVVNDLKLSNGLIFGLPVVFDTNDARVVPGAKVLLQYKNVPIAVFDVCTTAYVIRIKPALCSNDMQCLL